MKRKLDNETLQEVLGEGEQVALPPMSILVNEADNLRHPAAPQEIEDLARSIMDKTQMQPVLVRPLSTEERERVEEAASNGNPPPTHKLILGYRRYAAVVYAREHLEGMEDLNVLARIVSTGDEMSLNLDENLKRKELGAMDISHAIARFKARGEDGKTIAARFAGVDGKPKTRAWVTQMAGLTTLRPAIQRQIQEGKLNQTLGRMLVGLEEDKQDEMLEQFKSGKVTTTAQASVERKKRKTKPDKRGRKANSAPSLKEAVKAFEAMAQRPEKDPETGKVVKLSKEQEYRRAVAEVVSKFLAGKIGAGSVGRALERL
jgi:ParB/RepB/Spo0J family partition protein